MIDVGASAEISLTVQPSDTAHALSKVNFVYRPNFHAQGRATSSPPFAAHCTAQHPLTPAPS